VIRGFARSSRRWVARTGCVIIEIGSPRSLSVVLVTATTVGSL
jgi:hypothetical protein